MDIITTHGLTKAYGTTTVVDHLDLAVPAGTLFGFLGPNGSGKSTTMKMLLGLARPSSGEIQVFGEPMNRATRRRHLAHIGSLIEAPSVYGHLTGAENMRIVQLLLGLDDAAIDHALAIVRLDQHRNKLVKQYSLGMKQRLGIAMALAHSPRLLILDEPTNGLDPAGIEEIRELLIALTGEGITVMVSSHLLAEMEKMVQSLAIIDHGRMLFQGTRAELFHRSLPDLIIETPKSAEAAAVLGRLPAVPGEGGIRVPGQSPQDTARLVEVLVHQGIPIFGVRRVQQSLEDIFIDLTGRGGEL